MTRRPRGFTLIEVLIALALLVLIFGIAYGIWTFVARTGTSVAWESGVERQLAQADSRLRDFVQASSYPSFSTPQGNVVLHIDNWSSPTTSTTYTTYYFTVNGFSGSDSTTTLDGGLSTDKVLLKFYRCQGGRSGIEGLPDSPVKGSRIQVYLKAPSRKTNDGSHQNADLYMQEQPLAFANDMTGLEAQVSAEPAANGTPTETLMVTDVNSVIITAVDTAQNPLTASTDNHCPVTVKIRCLEPTRSRTTREKTIAVVTNTGVSLQS